MLLVRVTKNQKRMESIRELLRTDNRMNRKYKYQEVEKAGIKMAGNLN